MGEVKILHEDADIIVILKPAGMASQQERGLDMDVASWLKNYLAKSAKKKAEPYIGVVHRLDKPVGGVMVYGKTPQATANLSEQIRANRMKKEYVAVLTGTLKNKEGELRDYLFHETGTNMTRVGDAGTNKAKEARLKYKVKRTKYENGIQYSLVNIELITGRHHQIRVQMAHAGAGLYGDNKYNASFASGSNREPLALFAWHLEFDHPRSKKHLSFKAEPGECIKAHFN